MPLRSSRTESRKNLTIMTLKEHAEPLRADCNEELTTNIVVCRNVDVSRFGHKCSFEVMCRMISPYID